MNLQKFVSEIMLGGAALHLFDSAHSGESLSASETVGIDSSRRQMHNRTLQKQYQNKKAFPVLWAFLHENARPASKRFTSSLAGLVWLI